MVGPWGQLIEGKDIASVFALVLLEGLLSGDNALVLAIMVKHLKKDEQKKALLYGLGGAFVFRFIAILFAQVILKQWWLQAIGALYLIFITAKHFIAHNQKDKEIKPLNRGFWATVIAVEITDIAFAVDSVLAGITFINNQQSKIWVVFLGAIMGIVLLRFAAGFFVRMLDKYPALDHVAYAIVGWVGVKLAFLSTHAYSVANPGKIPNIEMPAWLFWSVLLSIAGGGGYLAKRFEDKSAPEYEEQAEEIEDAQDLRTQDSGAEPEQISQDS